MTPLANIGIALLIAGLSVPLILRKVPMNSVYGVRFPQSFKSDEAWYEINAYGGKALLLATIPVFLVGVYGLFTAPEPSPTYSLISAGALVLPLIVACLASYLKARRVDQASTRPPH
jgi:uncharacterized membrane protein